MSKRIPVNLNEDELELVIIALSMINSTNSELTPECYKTIDKLIIKLEEQLRTFEET